MLRTKGTKGSVGFARSADLSLAREALGIEPVIRVSRTPPLKTLPDSITSRGSESRAGACKSRGDQRTNTKGRWAYG